MRASITFAFTLVMPLFANATEAVQWRYCTSELAQTFESYRKRIISGGGTVEDLTETEKGYAKREGDTWLKNHFLLLKKYLEPISNYSVLVGKCNKDNGVLFLKYTENDPRFGYVYILAKPTNSPTLWRIYNVSKESVNTKQIEQVPASETN